MDQAAIGLGAPESLKRCVRCKIRPAILEWYCNICHPGAYGHGFLPARPAPLIRMIPHAAP
jgi:hypothetical protein